MRKNIDLKNRTKKDVLLSIITLLFLMLFLGIINYIVYLLIASEIIINK